MRIRFSESNALNKFLIAETKPPMIACYQRWKGCEVARIELLKSEEAAAMTRKQEFAEKISHDINAVP